MDCAIRNDNENKIENNTDLRSHPDKCTHFP